MYLCQDGSEEPKINMREGLLMTDEAGEEGTETDDSWSYGRRYSVRIGFE